MTIQQVEKKLQWIDSLTIERLTEMLGEEFIQREFFDEWDLLATCELSDKLRVWKKAEKIRVLKEHGMATAENCERYVYGR